MLELLIEEVTGADFARYMDSSILDPLGMSDFTDTRRGAAVFGVAAAERIKKTTPRRQ